MQDDSTTITVPVSDTSADTTLTDPTPEVLPDGVVPLRLLPGGGGTAQQAIELKSEQDYKLLREIDERLAKHLNELGKIEMQISQLVPRKLELLQAANDAHQELFVQLQRVAKALGIDPFGKGQEWNFNFHSRTFTRTR